MKTVSRSLGLAALAAALAFAPVLALAAESASKIKLKDTANVVALFDGIDSGEIEVKLIPKSDKEATVLVTNKSGKPLTIRMPEAFAGVPALAQFGGCPGGGGANGVCPNQGGGMQGMGMGGGMMGGGMMGGGGMFNVAPEKVAKIKVVAVCLDHGKKDPNPRVPYNLIPIESYAKDSTVTELVKMLARGEIDQHSAQAAVWHLQNGLSWEEMAKKVGAKHLNGSVEPYFTHAHLQRALNAVTLAEKRADKASKQTSKGSVGEQSGE